MNVIDIDLELKELFFNKLQVFYQKGTTIYASLNLRQIVDGRGPTQADECTRFFN